ncbi:MULTISPECIES: MIP/aquaporin family protein [Streptomyces]|uniref:Glycerol uptake facilitator protein n=1 Tax=Streptomyces venezuelae (strain ATCC 10712 / CBS 650.69 / DSM 40230 / JCM 4526 / NBRC 13096 / PD 04745) TaxID=953739 RepID=F2RDZ9_STRVP|nr:MIP/aquaporin family protein [Streptomyces venezuelae]APE20626.1 aquaporin family protein [Streptomyces venezuelae]QER98015.1 aquaporin family protein [Streptomyces venezuelae ATCC 10712]QES05215.1 aquaporin family protein [Streptomyces venezuelae]QES16047.1 aquaporin family protein [Streptomyces venezuelae]CCA54539.1 Glycerol uptake facilitator protein [Streptomyces venezuelae ATCC 10712]
MSSSDIFLGETIGTAVLILLGGGVCAAVTLKGSKARNAGWLAITFGWGFAVMTAVYMTASLSGAHLNPAVTVGIAIKDGEWGDVPVYIAGQMLGAMIGAALVWVAYYGQFQAHLADPEASGKKPIEGPGPVLGIFSTGPEIRNTWQNLATEIIGTVVLVLAVLTQGLNDSGKGLGVIGALITAFVVVSIGLSLGGPTGYAINPARDLGPRIVHALLPLKHKGGSDWSYAWIPVAGPLIGGAIAAGIYNIAFA